MNPNFFQKLPFPPYRNCPWVIPDTENDLVDLRLNCSLGISEGIKASRIAASLEVTFGLKKKFLWRHIKLVIQDSSTWLAINDDFVFLKAEHLNEVS